VEEDDFVYLVSSSSSRSGISSSVAYSVTGILPLNPSSRCGSISLLCFSKARLCSESEHSVSVMSDTWFRSRSMSTEKDGKSCDWLSKYDSVLFVLLYIC